ncbi:MAG: dihydroorotase family protein [Candidatus Bathyarchaeia archaeon]
MAVDYLKCGDREDLTVDLVLINAKIYTPDGIVDAGVAVDEGRIFKIAKGTNLPPASERLDLKGLLVLPGLIDAHVHLRDQQLAYKEDFFSGTASAAAGGVTSVIDMPNNKPLTMSSKALRERMKIAERKVITNVAFYSAFPTEINEICAIIKEGAVAFKLFLSQKIGGLDAEDNKALLEAFNEVNETKAPIAVHAEDRETIEKAERELRNAGRKDVLAYLDAHSPEAESKAIQRTLYLVEQTHAHVHFCHLSSAAGLSVIQTAKKNGLPITCEVTPHHLFLSSKDLKNLETLALVDPPLRTQKDNDALWDALKRGRIDVISSDHAPHAIEEKKAHTIWDVKPGIPGLETMLPLLLTQVNEGRLSLSDMIRTTSEKPAQIFSLQNRGSLVKGNHADIVAVDMSREYNIDSSKFHSKAKYSPFDGWRVKGKPVKTFLDGKLVMDEGEVVAKPGTGRIIR